MIIDYIRGMIDYPCINCEYDLNDIIEDWKEHKDNSHIIHVPIGGIYKDVDERIIVCPNCGKRQRPYYDEDYDCDYWIALEEE